jgi:DNA polymerase I-like protein with 3'-5' exonuclease and polymerase domains
MKEKKWISLDFETNTANKYNANIVCLGWCEFDLSGHIYDKGILGFGPVNKKKLPPLKERNVVMHGSDFDLFLLNREEHQLDKAHDTLLMAKHWRNDLPSYSLKALSWYLFGELYLELSTLEQWFRDRGESTDDESNFDMSAPPPDLVGRYCLKDVEMTAKLACWLYPKVADNYAYQQDIEFNPINIEIQSNGITVDKKFLRRFVKNGKQRIKRRTSDADTRMREAGVLEGKKKPTGDAVRTYLGGLGETRRTLKSRKILANEVVFRGYEKDKIIQDISIIKSVQKEVNTYAKNLLTACGKTDRFHPNLVMSAAITRRFRSWSLYGDTGQITRGQVQNFPRGHGIRDSIVTPPGFVFGKLDLASIEARLGAHLMAVFLKEFWFCNQYKANDSFNIYLHVVKTCTGNGEITKKDHLYQAYKHGCLGIQYGVGSKTFYVTMHDKFNLPVTENECSQIYANINRRFPVFKALQRVVSALVEKQGFLLDDFGAIYYVPKEERYKGVNYLCQGCAGNILKWWGLEIHKRLVGKDYIFCEVHDEFDMALEKKGAGKRAQMYCDTLKSLDLFSLPIRAEWSIGRTWADVG